MIPHITKEQARAAFINAGAPTELMRVYNERIDAANLAAQPEKEYITAYQARELGFGNAEYRLSDGLWRTALASCQYLEYSSLAASHIVYRALKKPEPTEADLKGMVRPTPVDPHTNLRAEFAKQEAEGTLKFFKWKFRGPRDADWQECRHTNNTQFQPSWTPTTEYCFTDVSCLVAKDNEPAARMLRTKAVELHRSLGDTVDWFDCDMNPSVTCIGSPFLGFMLDGTYTYKTKGTIKLDGKLVTPEQAAAEWESKQDTHELHFKLFPLGFTKVNGLAKDMARYFSEQADRVEYELRANPVKPWTGSREDVISLLTELGLNK